MSFYSEKIMRIGNTTKICRKEPLDCVLFVPTNPIKLQRFFQKRKTNNHSVSPKWPVIDISCLGHHYFFKNDTKMHPVYLSNLHNREQS